VVTHRSGAKGGELTIDSPGQHVLERTSVLVTKDTVALPAQGRSVLGTWAAQVLVEQLPRFVQASLLYRSLDARRLQLHLATVEDAAHLRAALRPAGLVRALPHLTLSSHLA
jgi:predicted ABC-class ATPase